MIEWGKIGELGATIIALLIILQLVEVVRKKYRSTPDGDRRSEPIIIKCPNHIEGLHSTLVALVNGDRERTAQGSRTIELLIHNRQQLDSLVKSHAPRDGREWWKTTPSNDAVQVEIRDGIKNMQHGINELVRLAKRNGGK